MHRMRLFYRRHRRDLPARDPLLSVRSLGARSNRPSLMSVLKLATAFGTSLLDFQTSKPPEVSHCLYDAASVLSSPTRRDRRPRDAHLKVQLALQAVLASHIALPTFRAFCAKLEVSTGYVGYHFPIESRKYADRRRELSRWKRKSATLAALKAANSGLIDDYRSGRIRQLKELIRAISAASGVHVLTARRVVDHCLASDADAQLGAEAHSTKIR